MYQMHLPDTAVNAPAEETIWAMDKLVQDGKVCYVGVNNYNVPLFGSDAFRKANSSLFTRGILFWGLPLAGDCRFCSGERTIGKLAKRREDSI
ncbi:aldo/keto reductase [Paenibacillus gyeongsangnamensis]|uniref:aldo/keto reductase n=1 Tax=Paenibacillus gyeongsangnamensis TaxID=3388067 RepID=UPI003907F1C3